MKEIISSQALKKELKTLFGVPFSVRRSGRYYHVSYDGGPAYGDVQRHMAQYDDTKGDDITTDLFVGSQYVILERHFTEAQYEAAADMLSLAWGIPRTVGINETSPELRDKTNHWTWGQWARNVLWQTDLRQPVTKYTSEGEQRFI